MGLKQRLRRFWDGENDVLEKASKIEKEMVEIDVIGRIADLKEAGLERTIEVERIGSDGRTGYQNVDLEMEDVEPGTFRDQIFDHLGGGRFKFSFRKPDGRLQLRRDNGKPEVLKIKVRGKPKGQEKTEKADRKKEDIPDGYRMLAEQQNKNMEMMMARDTAIITALLAKDGNGKIDQVELLKAYKEIAGDGAVDPVQVMTGFMQLMTQWNQQQQSRAPVQTTGSMSGMRDLGKGIAEGLAPLVLPAIADRVNLPGTPGAAALSANPNPNPNPNAFAGAEVAPNDGRLEQAPIGQVEGGRSDPGLAVSVAADGSKSKLEYIILQKDHPHSIAAEAGDWLNLNLGAQRIGGMWQNFITEDNAGPLFDQHIAVMPQFGGDVAYMAECRAALIEAVQHLDQDSEAEEEEAEEDQTLGQSLSTEEEAEEEVEDEVDDSSDGPEQVSTGEQTEDDRSA